MSIPPSVSVEHVLALLAGVAVAADDVGCVRQIEELERLKAAVAALQARVAADFAASQRVRLAALGVPDDHAARTIGSQLALARRESPTKGSRFLGFAEALATDMPCTLAALGHGETNEWRATLVVRETAVLDRVHRRAVDAELGPRLAELGDAETARAARRIGLRLDPTAAQRRAERAAMDRRVTIRPAPDSMAILSAVLPVADGVAAYAALGRQADLHSSTGDGRGRGQVMADALVDRLLGRGDEIDRSLGVDLQLVMTDSTLLGGDAAPAEIPGYGPIPAPLARGLIADAVDSRAQAFVRRLFTEPTGRRLVAMDSARRRFPAGMARLIRARDGVCRTPWCGAPIRHIDHVVPVERGGPTAIGNGQGLCERCNYTKQTLGWRSAARADTSITITTPTGRRYLSRPPPLPGAA